jgi:hypothetical protein
MEWLSAAQTGCRMDIPKVVKRELLKVYQKVA